MGENELREYFDMLAFESLDRQQTQKAIDECDAWMGQKLETLFSSQELFKSEGKVHVQAKDLYLFYAEGRIIKVFDYLASSSPFRPTMFRIDSAPETCSIERLNFDLAMRESTKKKSTLRLELMWPHVTLELQAYGENCRVLTELARERLLGTLLPPLNN